MVIANTAAANRDAAVYAEPDQLDLCQEDAAPMPTFGGGAHFCSVRTSPASSWQRRPTTLPVEFDVVR